MFKIIQMSNMKISGIFFAQSLFIKLVKCAGVFISLNLLYQNE